MQDRDGRPFVAVFEDSEQNAIGGRGTISAVLHLPDLAPEAACFDGDTASLRRRSKGRERLVQIHNPDTRGLLFGEIRASQQSFLQVTLHPCFDSHGIDDLPLRITATQTCHLALGAMRLSSRSIMLS